MVLRTIFVLYIFIRYSNIRNFSLSKCYDWYFFATFQRAPNFAKLNLNSFMDAILCNECKKRFFSYLCSKKP
jgi:hypothetical protein